MEIARFPGLKSFVKYRVYFVFDPLFKLKPFEGEICKRLGVSWSAKGEEFRLS